MGMCYDTDENDYGLAFEINRESITFYGPDDISRR